MSTPTSSQPVTAPVSQQSSSDSNAAQQQPTSPRGVNKLPNEILFKIFDCIGETRNWKDFRAFRHISPRTVLASNCTERIDSYAYHVMTEAWVTKTGKAIEGPNVFWRSLLWECGVRIPAYADTNYNPPVLERRKNNEAEEAFWLINMERLVAHIIYRLSKNELVTQRYTTDRQEAELEARSLLRTCSLQEISAQFARISRTIGVVRKQMVLDELEVMDYDFMETTQFSGLARGVLNDREVEVSDDVHAVGKMKMIVDRYKLAVDFVLQHPVHPEPVFVTLNDSPFRNFIARLLLPIVGDMWRCARDQDLLLRLAEPRRFERIESHLRDLRAFIPVILDIKRCADEYPPKTGF